MSALDDSSAERRAAELEQQQYFARERRWRLVTARAQSGAQSTRSVRTMAEDYAMRAADPIWRRYGRI